MNDLQEEPERSPKIKWLQREVTQQKKRGTTKKKERKKERKKALGNKHLANNKHHNKHYKDMVKDASCIGMDISLLLLY
jgi:hypothetical protein